MTTKRLFFRVGACLFGLLVLLFLLPLVFAPTQVGAVLTCLPFGWLHFLNRNIPLLTFNWDMLATGIIFSVAVIVLGNRFLRGVFNMRRQNSSVSQPPLKWRWRWTICSYCVIWLLFVIAIGSAGVLRHTSWLLEYSQPWYQMDSFMELRIADRMVQELMIEHDQDLESTRRALGAPTSFPRRRNPITEEFNFIFYGDRTNKVAAYLIIPRNSHLSAKGEFIIWRSDATESAKPILELQKTIADLDAAYPPGRFSAAVGPTKYASPF